MVRVISIHNFQKQHIAPVDEIIDVATVPPDTLLLVQSNHTILVKNLTSIDDAGYSVPTVDEVRKIIHSLQGNYIGTLEVKFNRNNEQISFVRIYLNWESLAKSTFQENNAPMRARIAGRVTPSSQTHHDLEMIEIPTSGQPDNIACCKISGNLIISSKNILSIYKFMTHAHDISKLYFVDFELVPVDFQISFVPNVITLTENIIAAQNDDCLHVFEVTSTPANMQDQGRDFSIEDFEKLQKNRRKCRGNNSRNIRYEAMMKENKDYQPIQVQKKLDDLKNTEIDNISMISNSSSEIDTNFDSQLSKIDFQSFPIIHEFPTVIIEKSLVEPKCSDVHRQNPFIINKDLIVNLVSQSPNEAWDTQYEIKNILQFQLTTILIGSSTNKELHEKYTCLKMRQYYCSAKEKYTGSDHRFLESEHFKHLKCISCFFATQQEGYLFCLNYKSRHSKKNQVKRAFCCAVYPFTAPVIDVVLEESLLHALTDTGLETYTVRAAQYLLRNTENETCPDEDDPICLLGLRPFLNTKKLTLTNNYLSLFANSEDTSSGMWTMYSLQIPHPSLMWNDFLTLANENKYEAPTTYCHLVGEGHLILKTFLNNIQWSTYKDMSKSQINIAYPANFESYNNSVLKLYQQSCALLADCHILSNNVATASRYYKMSSFKILNIIKSVQNIYEDIPSKYRSKYEESNINKALIYHLSNHLKEYNLKYVNYSGNKEEFYTPEIGNFVTVLMDLLEKESPDTVSDIVLESVILRDFGTDRILKIMKTLLSKRTVPQDKDALSLSLMCIQRGQTDQAKTVLQSMNNSSLSHLLLQHWNLLLEKYGPGSKNSFSELSTVLIEIYPEMFATVLITLVLEKYLFTMSEVLETFLEFLPSGSNQSKNPTLTLQLFLQSYFKFYFENYDFEKHDSKIVKALKIMIRIYLSGCQSRGRQSKKIEINLEEMKRHNILFFDKRYKFLNRMPPFANDIHEILSPTHSEPNYLDEEQSVNLLKLQSLLCSKKLPEECVVEVKNFLLTQPKTCGFISLQSLCSASVQEVLHLLIDFCPQALYQYSLECISKTPDWKVLVSSLQNKVSVVADDSRRKFYYEKILSDILHHLAETLSIEDLIDIFPNNYEDSEKYLIIAQNTAQANHMQTLIMVTGQQLLATL